MIVARNPRHPKQRLAVRATMAVAVCQVMSQERQALHEKTGGSAALSILAMM
jgi:hypothetical protein